MQLVFSFAQV
jgi:hypothetical protein